MSLNKIIRNRSTVRNFTKRIVPNSSLRVILEAGVWGPSLMGKQILRVKVLRGELFRNKILDLLGSKLSKLGICARVLFTPSTMKAIKTANVLLAIYSSGDFSRLIGKFSKFEGMKTLRTHRELSEQAELCAVSASVQNMILQAEELGLGSCWLHLPVYFSKELNRMLDVRRDWKFICILAVGFPWKREKRARRGKFSNLVQFNCVFPKVRQNDF